jgi:site-specific recombinase XerD
MTDGICFVGLDVHARKTAAAAVQLGSGEVFKAQLSGAPSAAIEWLVTLPGPVRAVYEAGPTGFGLARAARAAGLDVMVCSPGAIPRQPGDRIKTDTRDALKLARLHAAGQRVTAGEVTGFVLVECRRRSVRMSRSLTVSLRGLLRFLFLEGLTSSDVSAAVPSVAGWRGGSLPKAVPAEHVRRLLASCDRTTAVGRRDFAVLPMLSRLGVRAGEVAALQLRDVDWRAGEVVIRGKGDRHERLPLPTDVGEALVDYLQHGRPGRKDPHLFLRARAPLGPLTGGDGAIGMLVRAACRRAGLAPVGAHRLRHSVATETLRAGAPLEEIASLLRHRRHATTVIYAKVDWIRLRELARPWPGSAS